MPIGSTDAGGETMLGASPYPPLARSVIACGSNMCWLAAANIEQIDPVVER